MAKRHWLVASALLLVTCMTGEAWADTRAPVGPEPYRVLNILVRWWMDTGHDGDHMSTIDPNELPIGDFDGQMFYVLHDCEMGTSPLHRLYSETNNDHMDSNNPFEGRNSGGFVREYTHGHTFDVQQPGTCILRRWFKPAISDHTLGFCGEDMTKFGYTMENTYGYAYTRYGTQCSVPLTVRGDEVLLEANKVAGGAISRLSWRGIEFVNLWDYGRLIQVAFNLSRTDLAAAPTEAGDIFGCQYNTPESEPDGRWAHGSPLMAWAVTGKTLTTTTAPLLWSPEPFGGGPANPVVYNGTISKQIDVDFEGITNVIRWTTSVQLPARTDYFMIQIPTGYHTDGIHTYFTYDAESDASPKNVSDMVPASAGGDGEPCYLPSPPPLAGGIMMSTEDSEAAPTIGVYRKDETRQQIFTLCDYNHFSTGGTKGNHTPRWDLRQEYPNGLGAGTHSWVSYLVVGTKAEVRTKMRRLFRAGF